MTNEQLKALAESAKKMQDFIFPKGRDLSFSGGHGLAAHMMWDLLQGVQALTQEHLLQVEPRADVWECDFCKLLNHVMLTRCYGCGKPRVEPACNCGKPQFVPETEWKHAGDCPAFHVNRDGKHE